MTWQHMPKEQTQVSCAQLRNVHCDNTLYVIRIELCPIKCTINQTLKLLSRFPFIFPDPR